MKSKLTSSSPFPLLAERVADFATRSGESRSLKEKRQRRHPGCLSFWKNNDFLKILKIWKQSQNHFLHSLDLNSSMGGFRTSEGAGEALSPIWVELPLLSECSGDEGPPTLLRRDFTMSIRRTVGSKGQRKREQSRRVKRMQRKTIGRGSPRKHRE